MRPTNLLLLPRLTRRTCRLLRPSLPQARTRGTHPSTTLQMARSAGIMLAELDQEQARSLVAMNRDPDDLFTLSSRWRA